MGRGLRRPRSRHASWGLPPWVAHVVRGSRPTLDTIDFFVYSRAARSAADVEHDPALDEEHWSYMDGFADGMIARGPTLAADRATWTGSVHIVDLPSAEAAREFVEREPYNRAGLFEQHNLRRFKNLLGRSMWESPGGSDDPRFLVIAHVLAETGEPTPAVRLPDFTALARERLIVHGELLTPDEARPVGVVLALQAPTPEAVDALLRDRQGGLDKHFDVQIHDWEFGGRR
jgi:uncharacterized protein YciI